MNQDGSNRRTIIDSTGSIYQLSEDRTKMLIVNDGDIYIANTDGSGMENLTNTPDRIEDQPSFSQKCEKVIYHYSDFEDSISVIACKEITTGLTYNIYEELFDNNFTYFKSPVFINSSSIIFGQSYSGSDSLDIEGLFLFDGENKILIDPGNINAKITYNEQKNLVAYINSASLKLYHPDTGEIEIIDESYSSSSRPVFNRDGSLLAITKYIYDISTFEMFDVLQYFEDEIANINNSMDFNKTSTKVIMNLSRVFPNSNEEGRL
jgi:hypothetical protein